MEKHLKDSNILYNFQSGFRTSYSTDTCLINLQDGIRMEISQGKYVFRGNDCGFIFLFLLPYIHTYTLSCEISVTLNVDYT